MYNEKYILVKFLENKGGGQKIF